MRSCYWNNDPVFTCYKRICNKKKTLLLYPVGKRAVVIWFPYGESLASSVSVSAENEPVTSIGWDCV